MVRPWTHKTTGRVMEIFDTATCRPPISFGNDEYDSWGWQGDKPRNRIYTNAYQFDNSITTIEHLVPTKKDLPIYLNWPFNLRLCRACADFGAAANIINVNYAREINVAIIPDRYCEPFELPTFGKLIRPIGRARITCAFPDESDTIKEYDFFVFENFVYQVIMGREFLRETRTLDIFQHRLHDRATVKRKVPIVASLGTEEEALTIFVNGEALDSAPDTGSEVNVMSLEFATGRGYSVVQDDVHAVCFADGSLQDVIGRVTVPLSFSNGPPPNVLVKLVNQVSATQSIESNARRNIEEPNYLHNMSIAAEFYILDGLKNNMILGEDLLASVNAFVNLSGNFKAVTPPDSMYPGLAAISLLKKVEKHLYSITGKAKQRSTDPLRELDITDSREWDRYKREQERIKTLPENKRDRATLDNEMIRQDYLRRRSLLVSSLRREEVI